jgi:rare lipoprotein A
MVLGLVASLGAAQKAQQPDNGRAGVSASRGSPDKAKTGPSVRSKHRKSNKPFQVGRASWYGKRFHGKTTASGESYDMFQFTAAHRQLALGTWLRVTNLRNGRWVIVRVNDRGPVPPSRIIDLSYGAAQMLELRYQGVERVRLDVVTPDTIAMNVGGME